MERVEDEPNDAAPPDQQFFLDGNFLPISFRQESYVLAHDIVQYVCCHENAPPSPNKTATIMRSLVDDLLKSRLESMHDLVLRFDVRDRQQLEMLNSLATMMFDDQIVTWGRIVTLYAFCGYLARYCQERNLPDYADSVTEILNSIIVNRLGLWIVANGGWESFDRQFPSICMFETGSIWKGVGIVALLFGAAAAFYSSIRFMNPPSG